MNPSTVVRIMIVCSLTFSVKVFSQAPDMRDRGGCVPTPPCNCDPECLRCGPGGCHTGGGQSNPQPATVTYPHLYLGTDGKYHPEPWYGFANPLDRTDPTVVRIQVGAPHPSLPHIVWMDESGMFRPAPGYFWEDNEVPRRGGWRVRLSDKLTRDSAGVLHPRSGFHWCNGIPNDYSVCPDTTAVASSTYQNVVRGPDGRLKPADGYEWLNLTPGDFRVQPKQGINRTATGYQRWPNYRWVHPNDPNNLEVEMLPGLQRGEDAKIHPLEGFRWLHPEDPNNYAVVPVAPPTTLNGPGLENIRRFIATCRLLMADPDTSDEQLKLHCGNVQSDGARP